nr:hypothetical protein [uncultured Steroidobacter sp.]
MQPPSMIVDMLAITSAEQQQVDTHGIDLLLDRCAEGRLDELDFLRQ